MRRVLLCGLLAIGSVSCGDDDPLGLNGSVAFSHSGAVNGTFEANGRFPLTGTFAGSEWAAGGRDVASGSIAFTGVMPATGQRYHMVIVSIPRLSPGSATIDPTCTASACAEVAVEFDVSDTDNDASHFCFLDAGTVAIASISDDRASGSFSGTGFCSNALGVTQSFAVSGGTFNVPLLGNGSFGP